MKFNAAKVSKGTVFTFGGPLKDAVCYAGRVNDGEFQSRIATKETTMLARTLTALALATTLAAVPGTAEAGHVKQIKEKLQEKGRR